jgi:hypothetical protein
MIGCARPHNARRRPSLLPLGRHVQGFTLHIVPHPGSPDEENFCSVDLDVR